MCDWAPNRPRSRPSRVRSSGAARPRSQNRERADARNDRPVTGGHRLERQPKVKFRGFDYGWSTANALGADPGATSGPDLLAGAPSRYRAADHPSQRPSLPATSYRGELLDRVAFRARRGPWAPDLPLELRDIAIATRVEGQAVRDAVLRARQVSAAPHVSSILAFSRPRRGDPRREISSTRGTTLCLYRVARSPLRGCSIRS